jgi:Replication initiator protein A
MSMELLHKKSGSRAFLKEFGRKVKMIVESDVRPDYRLRYQPEADQVLFYTKDPKRLAESVGPSPLENLTSVHQRPIIGLSDTKVSVHQTPMLRSIRHRGPKIRPAFARL